MNGLPSWALPLVVVALLVPIVAGLVLAGPQGMFFAAVIVALVLIVIAARSGRGTPIDVAASDDGRHHVLIAANEAIDSPRLAERIVRHVERRRGGDGRDADVLVVSPALNPLLDHWAADVADARQKARARLDASLDRLSWAGLDARGSVGDSNPMLAIEDALREFPADEVLVVAGEATDGDFIQELRDRLDRPVEALSSSG